MRVLIDIGHPGHVHFFKHTIWQLQKQGHMVYISARKKDVTLELLDYYGFSYQTVSSVSTGRAGMYREYVQHEWNLLNLLHRLRPDVVTAIGGVFIAPAAKIMRIPSLVFTDTEHVAADRYLTLPFATAICTPGCFKKDIGNHHLRYDGYHELAYLHPKRLQQDEGVLKELGILKTESFVLLRFVAWGASHDIDQHGFPIALKYEAIQRLSKLARVFISSESSLPAEFEHYRLKISPHLIHDVLAHAALYLGEGATMATEAGILGTPSIYTSSLVGTMGNFIELMDRYQLVLSYNDPRQALDKAVELLENPNTKCVWQERRERLLSDKIDVTPFIIAMIESYGRDRASYS